MDISLSPKWTYTSNMTEFHRVVLIKVAKSAPHIHRLHLKLPEGKIMCNVHLAIAVIEYNW